jgi:4-hydroxy-tetrahydrodipicolinate reductase
MTNLLLLGHGRMGQLVERLASSHDCRIVGIVTEESAAQALVSQDFGQVDVAVDFTVAAAVRANLHAMAGRGWNVVIGTTGWQSDEAECRAIVAKAGTGVLASANFSIGMQVFRQVVEEAARRFAGLPDVGAWIHESHHAAKKDAPSGTALLLKGAMEQAGYGRAIDVSSTRAGSIPGTHEIGFDALAESVTLVHQVRDRAVFAHGALEAAKWLKGKRGWYSMADMLGKLTTDN